MQLCFFEDESFTSFHPLTLSRPVDDLRIGILTIAQKWEHALDANKSARILRQELEGVFEAGSINENNSCIWINARYLPTASLVKELKQLGPGNCLQHKNTVIAAHTEGATSAQWFQKGEPNFNELFVLESGDFHSLSHLWQLFKFNGIEIKNDIALLQPERTEKTNISKHAIFENESDIYIADGVSIEANSILDARKGPIFIGEDAAIKAGSVIYGPTAICEHATVKTNTTIYSDTTVGPVCKVGGEISNTIFHSYSNKAHDGYIGNSVVGQWCNFGAGTTVSNLKTNYSSVRVTDWESSQEKDSGQQFLGIIMGDHSKTAINCVINSGTVCGVNCNILSRDFPPKFIPSFSWVGSNVIHPYKLEKALDTMQIMMARRDIITSDSYKKMMRHISENSRHNK